MVPARELKPSLKSTTEKHLQAGWKKSGWKRCPETNERNLLAGKIWRAGELGCQTPPSFQKPSCSLCGLPPLPPPTAPPPRSGVFAGSFQIAFTKREVEAVGGASWTSSQFDYLRASLAEAWPGGSAQAKCSWFSDFTNFGSHEERWYLYESLTSLQSPYSFQMWPLTSLPCHRDREPRRRSVHISFTCSPQPNVRSSLVWACGWSSKMPVLLVFQLESGEAYLPSRSNTNCQLGILTTSQYTLSHTSAPIRGFISVHAGYF